MVKQEAQDMLQAEADYYKDPDNLSFRRIYPKSIQKYCEAHMKYNQRFERKNLRPYPIDIFCQIT